MDKIIERLAAKFADEFEEESGVKVMELTYQIAFSEHDADDSPVTFASGSVRAASDAARMMMLQEAMNQRRG